MIAVLEPTTSFIVNNAAGISAVVAVCVFGKSIYEYTLKNKLDRFDKYQGIAAVWDENKDLQKIRLLLEAGDDDKLATIAPSAKQNFITCYEDIAVMHESGLLSERMAFYLFGFYAIRSYKSEAFWKGLDKKEIYHTLFCRFGAQMESVEKRVLAGDDDPQRWRFKI